LDVGELRFLGSTSPPKLDAAAQAAFKTKAEKLAAKYQTELLPP
jgi:hypothetical protein